MLNIIVGSQTGTAEFVADDILSLCQDHNISAQITLDPRTFNEEDQTWIICTSTHGAGEVPDNLKPFMQYLQQQPNLSHIDFLVIALGDSSYDTYCEAGQILQQTLINLKAKQITDIFTVDAMDESLPEDLVIPWLTSKLSLISK